MFEYDDRTTGYFHSSVGAAPIRLLGEMAVVESELVTVAQKRGQGED